MNKLLLLKISITFNFIIMLLSLASFYVFNELDTKNSYFHIGWSKKFVLISIIIDTPFKYFTLCSFIVITNVSEILMDNIAVPIIQFSTYNPVSYTHLTLPTSLAG